MQESYFKSSQCPNPLLYMCGLIAGFLPSTQRGLFVGWFNVLKHSASPHNLISQKVLLQKSTVEPITLHNNNSKYDHLDSQYTDGIVLYILEYADIKTPTT